MMYKRSIDLIIAFACYLPVASFFSKNKLVGTQKPLPRQSLHIPGDNDDHSVAPLEFTIIYLGFYIKKDWEKN